MIKRLEYIDAMRGLAMVLVVVGHVLLFAFKDAGNVLFRVLNVEIEVPLFFMVSGYLMKVPEHRYLSFFKKKAFLLCVPAAIFMAVYVWMNGYDYLSAWIDSDKYGYWFTFSLFEFIVLYVVLKYAVRKIKPGFYAEQLLLFVISVVILFASVWCMRQEDNYFIIPLLGLTQFKFFIYFVFGAILAECEKCSNKLICNMLQSYSGGVILIFYIVSHIYTYKDGGINYIGSSTLWFALITISGLLVLLYGFKQYVSWSTSWVGKRLQMVGRYTLDVYFIHYFFLPRNLNMVGEWFKANPNPLIEYVSALLIAVVLIAVSLFVGRIIRLSPILAHWLLAENKNYKK